MLYEGFVDILFSGDEDIEFLNGDIRTTNGIDAIKRELFKQLISEQNDWPLYPNEGASLNEFVGQPNTRDTAEAIKRKIIKRLSPVVFPAGLKVVVVPFGLEEVAVGIKIVLGEQVVGGFSLKIDYINGITYSGFDDKIDKLVSDKNTRINEPGKIRQSNKYWDQIRKQ